MDERSSSYLPIAHLMNSPSFQVEQSHFKYLHSYLQASDQTAHLLPKPTKACRPHFVQGCKIGFWSREDKSCSYLVHTA